MVDEMQDVLCEGRKNRFSTLGKSSLSDEDVVSVWDNVSAFVDKQMSQQKGVTIPGLGTFTFSQKKLDMGNCKYLLIQRPIFVVSEKLAATHGLTYNKHYTSGQIPVVSLNYSALSFESPFDRDTVETCVREVVGAVSRSIAAKKNVEFLFSGIGRLLIKDNKVKMRFYKTFLNSMDASGQLIDTLSNRPGTVDSVMSERPFSRPNTVNTFVLPRIPNGNSGELAEVETTRTGLMPAIQEETINQQPLQYPNYQSPVNETKNNAETDGDLYRFCDDLRMEDFTDAKFDEGADSSQNHADVPNVNDHCNSDANDEPLKPSPPPFMPPSRQGSRMSLQLPKAAAVSFADDLLATSPKPEQYHSFSRPITPVYHSLDEGPKLASSFSFTRSKTLDRFDLAKTHNSQNGFAPTPPPPPAASSRDATRTIPDSACGHRDAGQELCYLCHQRDRRNIPVSFEAERRKREVEEDRLLQQYNQLKDLEAMQRDQEKSLGQRHESQKTAAFNLGIAEAVQQKKVSKGDSFQPSFVFQKRPLTPPRYLSQEEYYKELANQAATRAETVKKYKSDEAFLEKLEQVQLAEDLAARREKFLKEKLEQQDQYKRALSAQLRHKPPPLPGRVPDSDEPLFGKNDITHEGMQERRRRAQNLYREQLESVEQKKRDAILRRLNEQRDEEGMLERTKKELREDRADRYDRILKNRRRLEEEWIQAAEVKKLREAEEKVRTRSPGSLLLDQTNIYKRCGQCKRKLNNKGESNVWRESRYIPGSRLIV